MRSEAASTPRSRCAEQSDLNAVNGLLSLRYPGLDLDWLKAVLYQIRVRFYLSFAIGENQAEIISFHSRKAFQNCGGAGDLSRS
jgi:hypothetical protein